VFADSSTVRALFGRVPFRFVLTRRDYLNIIGMCPKSYNIILPLFGFLAGVTRLFGVSIGVPYKPRAVVTHRYHRAELTGHFRRHSARLRLLVDVALRLLWDRDVW